MDWRQQIVELVILKQKIYDNDSEKLWDYRLPEVAATEDQLIACETCIGERLDDSYREFLSRAGGWEAFFQTVDLFGPNDLCAGPRFERGATLVGQLDEGVVTASGFSKAQLLPIAASRVEIDLFAMTRRTATTPGAVLWFAGEEVDRFPDFAEFFAAMLEYNRAEFDDIVRASRV